MRRARRTVLSALLLVSGCETFGKDSTRDDKPQRSHLEITVVSRCAHPVDVCYAGDTCVNLPDGKPRRIKAPAVGNQVMVTLKGGVSRVYADETFSAIEVDDACQRLDRHVGERKESSAAAAGGPSPDR